MTMTEDGARGTLPDTEASGARGRSRFALVIAALAALAVGFGAGWLIRGDSSDDATTDTEVPAEVSTLIDDWYAANERADGSVLDLYLPSGYHLYGDVRIDYAQIPDHLGGNPDYRHEWITEPILITADDDGSYVVVRGMRNVLEARGWDDSSALAFEIETTDDGSLKLAQTAWIYRQIRTGESGPPTATFDDDRAIYTGPSTVVVGEDGTWTARFINDTEWQVYWSLAMLDDHPPLRVYRSEMTRWFFTDAGGIDRPPYVVDLEQGRLHPKQSVEVPVEMTGTVALDVFDAYGMRWYPAGFVEIETGTD